MNIDKIVLGKRVPIFAVNPDVYILCANEDKDENQIATLKNKEVGEYIIAIQENCKKWKEIAKKLYNVLDEIVQTIDCPESAENAINEYEEVLNNLP